MGIVSRTKRVLRRAGRLENLSKEQIRKAVRPFGGGLLGTKRLVARYHKNGDYLHTSLEDWVAKRDAIIAGKIKPKFVKGGGTNYMLATGLLGVSSGFASGINTMDTIPNTTSIGRILAVGTLGTLALGFAAVGTAAVIQARKRWLFNVLNSKIHVGKIGKSISPVQVRENRVVFNKVEELLKRLAAENSRQLTAIERYRQTAYRK